MIADTDVLYVNRVQGERFASQSEYEAAKDAYCVDKAALRSAKLGMQLMNPLPRVGEIHTELVDTNQCEVLPNQAAEVEICRHRVHVGDLTSGQRREPAADDVRICL